MTSEPNAETSAPPPSRGTMPKEGWDAHYASREAPDTAAPHVRLAEVVDGMQPGRALDLGCGFGRNAVWLATEGWDVTAVDFSSHALAGAKTLASSCGVQVQWVESDLLEYEAAHARYDLVLVFFVHLSPDDRPTLLRRAAAAVAPGGSLVVAAHHRDNLAEGYKGPKDPAVLFAPEDVVPFLEGLEIERAERVRRTIETDQGSAVMIDTIVHAIRPTLG